MWVLRIKTAHVPKQGGDRPAPMRSHLECSTESNTPPHQKEGDRNSGKTSKNDYGCGRDGLVEERLKEVLDWLQDDAGT